MGSERELVASIGAICDPGLSTNPVAWFNLHIAGMTVDLLRQVSSETGWIGPKPLFENAPDQNGAMWKHLVASGLSGKGE